MTDDVQKLVTFLEVAKGMCAGESIRVGMTKDNLDLAITALQQYQFPLAIQWTGKNLREVIDLIGLNPSANKWTWEEYEQVVAEKGLKIFTPDGSVMASIGDWIIWNGKDCFVTALQQMNHSNAHYLADRGEYHVWQEPDEANHIESMVDESYVLIRADKLRTMYDAMKQMTAEPCDLAMDCKTGNWVQTCSVCGFTTEGFRRFASYCANCGSPLKEVGENE